MESGKNSCSGFSVTTTSDTTTSDFTEKLSFLLDLLFGMILH